jgi:hypothetical protein
MSESTDRNGAESEPLLLASTTFAQGARGLAELHQVPLVDLRAERVDPLAFDAIPLHVHVAAACRARLGTLGTAVRSR